MEHVVFFPAHDGSPAFRRVASLEEAVRLVEHLRNVEGVEQVSVHALTEVPLEFRPWYRVEMPSAAAAEIPSLAPVAESGPNQSAPEQSAPEQSAPEQSAPEQSASQPAAAPTEEVPAPALELPEQELPAGYEVPAKASLGFFSRG